MKKICFILLFLCMGYVTCAAAEEGSFIVISKREMMLRLYDAKAELLCEYPIACGKNTGQKQRPGDMRTPEGVFRVQQIQDASSWTHDFGDGKGQIAGAYGGWFIRLLTGHKGIGIHGTHNPASIGTRATEGCIRLHNENLEKFKRQVRIDMPVIITAD